MKAKHEPTGLTPEPVSRKLRLGEDESMDVKEDENRKEKEQAQDILAELQALKVQSAYLLAQHADMLREKARKEIVIGGWSMFTANPDDLEVQGHQLEAQTDSRERWVKELAKKAGITSQYYKDWTFSHQTRGDALSPITVVTVTQPWQRSKLFDYTKKHAVTDKLQEHFYIRDKEEQDWDRVVKTFGTYLGPPTSAAKHLKVQPQISLWDRLTGLPLKIAMKALEISSVEFKHNWRELTLTQKDSGEYIIWIHYSPEDSVVTIYMSEKHIPDTDAFSKIYETNFNEILNGGNKQKGKGKGKAGMPPSTQDKEAGPLPWTHTSHARYSKFPFALNARLVSDKDNHWDAWKTLWTTTTRRALLPFAVQTL